MPSDPQHPERTATFPTTRWNLVLQATEGPDEDAKMALEELCRAYWYPIYVYIRRKGYAPADAEDLAQGFFTSLLEREALNRVDADRGRLRTFLLTDLKNFIADETRRQSALKRGGGIQFAPLDDEQREQNYRATLSETGQDPETLYLRAWASTLIDGSIESLRTNYRSAGKSDVFDLVSEHLYGKNAGIPYEEIAAKLACSVSAARLTVFRMRQKFRAILESQIAHTVETTSEINAEVEFLFQILSRNPTSSSRR